MLRVKILVAEPGSVQAGHGAAQLDGGATAAPGVHFLRKEHPQISGGLFLGHQQEMTATAVTAERDPAGSGQLLPLQAVEQAGLALGQRHKTQAVPPGFPPLAPFHAGFNLQKGARPIHGTGRSQVGAADMAVPVPGDTHTSQGGQPVRIGEIPGAEAGPPQRVRHQPGHRLPATGENPPAQCKGQPGQKKEEGHPALLAMGKAWPP